MMATSGRSWLDRMLSRQSRSSGAPLQPLPPPGHVFVQSARSTTVGRAARVIPALAPACAAALARADAPRRTAVFGCEKEIGRRAGAGAEARAALGHAGRRLAEPRFAVADCERPRCAVRARMSMWLRQEILCWSREPHS